MREIAIMRLYDWFIRTFGLEGAWSSPVPECGFDAAESYLPYQPPPAEDPLARFERDDQLNPLYAKVCRALSLGDEWTAPPPARADDEACKVFQLKLAAASEQQGGTVQYAPSRISEPWPFTPRSMWPDFSNAECRYYGLHDNDD